MIHELSISLVHGITRKEFGEGKGRPETGKELSECGGRSYTVLHGIGKEGKRVRERDMKKEMD